MLCGFMRASALDSNCSMAVCTQDAKPWRPPLLTPPAPITRARSFDFSPMCPPVAVNVVKFEKEIFVFPTTLTFATINFYRFCSNAAISIALTFFISLRIFFAPAFRSLNSTLSKLGVFLLFGVVFSLTSKIFFITHRVVSDSFSIGAPSFLFASGSIDGGESFRVSGKFFPPAYFCSPQTFSSTVVQHDDGHSIYSLKGAVKCQRLFM